MQHLTNANALTKNPRLASLDVLRGIIMILLAAESTLLYHSLAGLPLTGFSRSLVQQFFHHPWNGLHFWDLVQPAFMTMAGAALYLSFHYKTVKGIRWEQNWKPVLSRSFRLFLFGVGLHCIYAGKPVWELWNVLTQLAVTTLIAYLIIRKSFYFQLCFSILLLVLTDVCYKYVLLPGFSQPFVPHHNFGSWMDTVLMGKINEDGWVAVNFIPTAAHTIWGVLAGKLLAGGSGHRTKLKYLVAAGLAGLVAGYALEGLGITPIIKRISTASFVLASGGWVLLMMAFLYWLIDVERFNRYAWIATVVGMNAIFIYLFFETVGIQWLNGAVAIFAKPALAVTGAGAPAQALFSAFITLCLHWGLCYWLYKKGIFFKV
jgi:predicted acyltransferase